ncbi:MAG: DUF1566 domain-containing protein [Chlamydiia bacterium]|nr:DUF1566 domain-containing protein [Chlamydiia bacterium]
MKKLFLILIGLSSLALADFTKNGDIVTDNITTLQWQDNTDANQTTEKWTDAIIYCENLAVGGFSDWRMPNINELLSIANKNKTSAPAISNTFKYVAYNPNDLTSYSILYWSSTTSHYFNDRAYTVNFNYGDEYNYGTNTEKDNLHNIRCVRGGN